MTFSILKKTLILGASIWIMVGCSSGKMMHDGKMMHTNMETTLYERLGGKAAIEAVVEDFVNRLATDKRIKNEKVAARFGVVHVPSLRTHLVNLICAGAGGPCKYTGRDMKSAHAGLEITHPEFNFVVEDLIAALNKFNVPEKEKGEVLALLGPMQKDIVEKP